MDGLFSKYTVTRIDGHPAEACFVVREGDPHLPAVLSAFPAARITTAGLVVCKTSTGERIDAAAVLPFNLVAGGEVWPVYAPAWPVRAALLAYARSCADESPALADDLRTICSSRLPDDQLAAAMDDAVSRGMPTCSSCGCICDPEGAGGVCMCDAACRFCSATDRERRAMASTREDGPRAVRRDEPDARLFHDLLDDGASPTPARDASLGAAFDASK